VVRRAAQDSRLDIVCGQDLAERHGTPHRTAEQQLASTA